MAPQHWKKRISRKVAKTPRDFPLRLGVFARELRLNVEQSRQVAKRFSFAPLVSLREKGKGNNHDRE
jgi:hypothetical protein